MEAPRALFQLNSPQQMHCHRSDTDATTAATATASDAFTPYSLNVGVDSHRVTPCVPQPRLSRLRGPRELAYCFSPAEFEGGFRSLSLSALSQCQGEVPASCRAKLRRGSGLNNASLNQTSARCRTRLSGNAVKFLWMCLGSSAVRLPAHGRLLRCDTAA